MHLFLYFHSVHALTYVFENKMEHELQRKNEALKSLESEVEKLQCGIICEKEQVTTMGIEHSDLRMQLQSVKEQKKQLENEMDELIQKSETKVGETKA